MILRAALLLLTGAAVFALGLLPAHASANVDLSAHAGDPSHASTSNAAPSAAQLSATGDAAEAAHHHHADGQGPHGPPVCHSAQTSSALLCGHVQTQDVSQLLMVLLLAGLALVAFYSAPAAVRGIQRAVCRVPLRAPIRREHGFALLTLDCVSRN